MSVAEEAHEGAAHSFHRHHAALFIGNTQNDGSKNYKLVVPPKVPVRNFWAITTYDLETASYIRNVEKSSIDSTQKQLQKNDDGSVDIYFGPKAPKGKESNWLPTDPKRRFFLLARFYGPEPALFDGSFELNDIELVK